MCICFKIISPLSTEHHASLRFAPPWRMDFTSVPERTMPHSKLSKTKYSWNAFLLVVMVWYSPCRLSFPKTSIPQKFSDFNKTLSKYSLFFPTCRTLSTNLHNHAVCFTVNGIAIRLIHRVIHYFGLLRGIFSLLTVQSRGNGGG